MDLSYGYYLCLDTATIFPQVGVLGGGKWVYFKRFENARADVLWEPLKECFRNFSWSGFIYNAGPGGMLGLHSTLMMIRIWKMLALYRTIPVGNYNGLAVASQFCPDRILLAQVCRGEVWWARRGEVFSAKPEQSAISSGALGFPTQRVIPSLLQACEVLDYNLLSAAELLVSSIRWDDSWREDAVQHSVAFVPWDGKRHGSGVSS